MRTGETLWAIARVHGVTADALVRINRLQDPDRLQIEDRLVIPTSDGTKARGTSSPAVPPQEKVHRVQPGETLWAIAKRHRTSVDALMKLNQLTDSNRIRPGQKILLTKTSSTSEAATAREQLAWPSRGVITSRFGFRGKRHHHGIDIAAPVGTPIYAARDGRVRFAGWMGGYGLLVILDNGNGLTTWSGHASQLLVKVGQQVRRGQLIAKVGTTGQVTGPNLHFEVRKNNVPLDPLKFLQSTR